MLDGDARLVPIRECLRQIIGGGTPPRNVSSYWNGPIPWASVKDFSDDKLEISDTKEHITPAGLRASASTLIPPGVPILCTRMAVGRVAAAAQPVAINQDLKALLTRPEVIEPRFLLYSLKHIQAKLEARAIGSTVKGLALRDLLSAEVSVFSIPEQRRIVETLDDIGCLIREAQLRVQKVLLSRRGLHHDLMTRGVDENGELRNSEERPELFKETPLGMIPRAWDVSNVEAEFEITSGITLGPHRKPLNHPYPYLRVANVRRWSLTLDNVAYLEARPVEVIGRTLDAGDLLIVEGHADPNEIGRCAIATEQVTKFTFQNHIFRLRPIRLRSSFGLQWLNGGWVRAYWKRNCSTSSGLNTINRKQLSALLVSIPSADEQKRIERIWTAVERSIELEEALLSKLHLLKQGIMADLLTGRVRVPFPEEAAK